MDDRKDNQALARLKRTEDALRASEERFRSLFENAVVGLYRTTPAGRILMANPAAVRMLGYDSFEALAERDLEDSGFEPSYPRAAFKERLEREGEVIGLESAWVRQDGTTLYVRESARAVRDPAGDIVYYEGTVEDITERTQAETRLTHLNAVLRAIRNVNQIIVTEKDRNRLLQRVCDGLIETRGYYNAWIALLDPAGNLMAAAEAGLGEAFAQAVESFEQGIWSDCSRQALTQPGVMIVGSPAAACANCFFKNAHQGRGVMVVRLEHAGRIYGLLCITTLHEMVADLEEQSLFAEVASDIALALHTLATEEARAQA